MSQIAVLSGYGKGPKRRRRRHHARRGASRRRSHRRSRRHSGGGMTPQRRRFKTAVKTCWEKMRGGKIGISAKSLGKCMRSELT